MHSILRKWVLGCSVTVAVCSVVTCSGNDSSGPVANAASSFGQMVAQYGDWNGALTDTSVPAQPISLPQTTITADNGDNWDCSNLQFEGKRNLDELLVPGTTAGVLWPGALIQGQSLIDGDPAEIPLHRSPIDISIDLGVSNASRHIVNPTSASVQAAIADLQLAADSRLGPIDPVPARVDFDQTEAFSSDQFILEFGGSIQASAPLKVLKIPLPGNASIGVNDSLGVQVSWQRHTIAVKLLQPMYTISFADEEMTEPRDYLDTSVTEAQLQDLVARGLISSTNLPTYVKSVTYGRMVVFTMTNTSAAATTELEGAIQASLNLFKLGVSGSASSKLSSRDSLLLQNSDLQVFALGGSQDSALAAIRTGDLGKFFTAVPSTQAVPLGYRINYLKTGRVALLGFGTTYTATSCTKAPGSQFRYFHLTLQTITSNGGCDSANYFRESFAFVTDASNITTTYPLFRVAGGAWRDTTVNREIVLKILTASSGGGNAAFAVDSWLYPGTTQGSTCALTPVGNCQREKDIPNNLQFPVNPYTYQDIITLPGVFDACTVTFTYQIFVEAAPAPPAPAPPRTQM